MSCFSRANRVLLLTSVLVLPFSLYLQGQTETITTVAGNGTAAYGGDGLKAIFAEMWEPDGVAVDSSGNIFIADSQNNRIRRVDHATQIITTVAGNGARGYSSTSNPNCPNNGGSEPGDGGPATQACLALPERVVVDATGNIFV